MASADVTEILDVHDDLRKQIEEQRVALQESDKEARKVPALQDEVQRLTSQLEGAQALSERRKELLHQREAQLEAQQLELRHAETLEEEIHEANEAAEKAEQAREEAEEKAAEAEQAKQVVLKQMDTLHKKMEELLPIANAVKRYHDAAASLQAVLPDGEE
jgi:colicin import membrane protein